MEGLSLRRGLTAVGMVALCAGSARAQNEWMDTVKLAGLHAQTTGAGVLIGQIESGTARVEHVCLNGALPMNDPNAVVRYVRSTGGSNANGKHATHVSSIIAGRTTVAGGGFKGAAPSSKLAVSNFVNPGGGLSWSDDFLSSMTDFFRVAPTTPIINMSAGLDPTVFAANDVTRVQQAADWMGATGYLFVAAAGNEGPGAGTIRSPGSGYNVLTVGATGETGALKNYHKIADYSSRGSVSGAAFGGTTRNKPDLVAPGSRIYSAREEGPPYNQFADNDFGGGQPFVSGTSFATPIVSGVAACLHAWGTAHALDKDPRVMRAVLMNSTSKSVQDDAGTRWDKIPNLGKGANSVSSVLGTGQLDATQAWQQYRAGETNLTMAGGRLGSVPQLGWDKAALAAGNYGNGNTYSTDSQVRRGSYMTSTVCWNRNITSGYNEGTGVNTWGDWAYATLNNLDIGVAKSGNLANPLQRSNGTGGTSEHSVFKVPERDYYYTTVYSDNALVGDATYGHAWQWFAAPDYTAEFNGNFKGERLHYLDNGWYAQPSSAHAEVAVTKPAFVPDNDEAWAMCVSSSDEFSQEMKRPYDSFTISFDYAFNADNGTQFQANLAGVNLFAIAGLPGGVITPDVFNTNQYATFTLSTNDPTLFNAITTSFIELTFVAFGGPDSVYIDNIVYIPTPGGALVIGAGLLAMGRRRRAA